jgi:hypothetical protein
VPYSIAFFVPASISVAFVIVGDAPLDASLRWQDGGRRFLFVFPASAGIVDVSLWLTP